MASKGSSKQIFPPPALNYTILYNYDYPYKRKIAMMRPLPASHRILPVSVDFCIPAFQNYDFPGMQTLAPSQVRCEDWFNEFADRVIASIGQSYLPVCRISDGEFKFLLGELPFDQLWPWPARLGSHLRKIVRAAVRRQFSAGGSVQGKKLYTSGSYSAAEWREARLLYSRFLKEISNVGILAVHLTHATPSPFQQHYFPAFGKWMTLNGVQLTFKNYVPFYFVYALLRGPRRKELFKGRRVLVVHGATGDKQAKILRALKDEGTAEARWLAISAERSLFDRLDCTPWINKIDICLVGAGIGKPNVLTQLSRLNVPCIDAGYVFEAWADPKMASDRVFMLPDKS